MMSDLIDVGPPVTDRPPTDDAATAHLFCPACGCSNTGATCVRCGCAQIGADADRWHQILTRLAEIERVRGRLVEESSALRSEEKRIRLTLLPPARPPSLDLDRAPSRPVASALSPSHPRRRWRVETVRDALLWTGAGLIVVSGISLAAVLWARDQHEQGAPLMTPTRGTVALALTCLATLGLALRLRRRLPATSEVLACLVVALVGVDWYVLRLAGVAGDADVLAWLAAGSLVAGLAAWGLVTIRFQMVGLTVPLLAASALAFAALAGTHTQTSTAAALALGALGLTLGSIVLARAPLTPNSSGLDMATQLVVGSEVVAFITAATALVIARLGTVQSFPDRIGPALVLVLVAVSPAVVAAAHTRFLNRSTWRTAAVGTSAAAIVGALAVLASALSTPAMVMTAVAAVGLVSLGVAVAVPTGREVRDGIGAASAGALGAATIYVLQPVIIAAMTGGDNIVIWSQGAGTSALARHTGEGRPLPLPGGWWSAAILLVLFGAVVIGGSRRGQPISRVSRDSAIIAGAIVCISVLFVTMVLIEVALWIVVAIEAGSAFAALGAVSVTFAPARRGRLAVATMVTATVLLGSAVVWSLASAATTIGLCGASGLLTTPSVISKRRTWSVDYGRGLWVASLLALVGSVAAAADLQIGRTGAIVTFAGLFLGGASFLRATRDVTARAGWQGASVIASFGVVVGISISATSMWWFGLDWTMVAMTTLLLARTQHQPALAAVGVLASAVSASSYSVATGIHIVEAYSLVWAFTFLVLGVMVRRARPTTTSFEAFGPGLVTGFAPSLAIVISQTTSNLSRFAVLIAAGIACLVWGVARRLEAAAVIGGLVLMTLAIRTLAPLGADAPRWIPLGIAGVILVWIGATAEHRLAQIRSVKRRLDSFT